MMYKFILTKLRNSLQYVVSQNRTGDTTQGEATELQLGRAEHIVSGGESPFWSDLSQILRHTDCNKHRIQNGYFAFERARHQSQMLCV